MSDAPNLLSKRKPLLYNIKYNGTLMFRYFYFLLHDFTSSFHWMGLGQIFCHYDNINLKDIRCEGLVPVKKLKCCKIHQIIFYIYLLWIETCFFQNCHGPGTRKRMVLLHWPNDNQQGPTTPAGLFWNSISAAQGIKQYSQT